MFTHVSDVAHGPLVRNYHSFEKGMALHLIKLEFSTLKDILCKVWLKLTHCFWRRRVLNVANIFCTHLPFEKGLAPHLNKLEFP